MPDSPQDPGADTADDTPVHLVPGRVIRERYRIVEPLKSGGMSQAFVADDLRLARRVAIKLFDASGRRLDQTGPVHRHRPRVRRRDQSIDAIVFDVQMP